MHFETDCLQLIKLIKNEEEWPSMVHVMEDISIASKMYDHFSISYTPRGRYQYSFKPFIQYRSNIFDFFYALCLLKFCVLVIHVSFFRALYKYITKFFV